MGLFGPSEVERLNAAAAALAPYKFQFDNRRAEQLRQYLPFQILTAPERYVTACFGHIEDATIEGYEYQSTSTDGEGNVSWYTHALVVVQHPSLPGGACFSPDYPEWGGLSAALDVLFWIPPFTLFKAIQWIANSQNPDRLVGHSEFDRLYRVRADSNETASRVITPALRDAMVRMQFKGSVEMRPGFLLYSPQEYRFDAQTAVSTIGVATVILSALREQLRAHPMR
jgi:hypothetical protein